MAHHPRAGFFEGAAPSTPREEAALPTGEAENLTRATPSKEEGASNTSVPKGAGRTEDRDSLKCTHKCQCHTSVCSITKKIVKPYFKIADTRGVKLHASERATNGSGNKEFSRGCTILTSRKDYALPHKLGCTYQRSG